MDEPPVWNTAVAGAARRGPSAQRQPDGPAGRRSVTSVVGSSGTWGVNTMASPVPACHVPSTGGLNVGSGEDAASGAEKTTRTGSAAVTASALLPGVIDSTRSSAPAPARGWLAA